MVGLRLARRHAWRLPLLVVVLLFAFAASAHAGTVNYWTGIQPKGNAGTNVPLVARGSCVPDGKPFVSSSAKLFVDGVEVPRASYTASIGTSSAYFYYKFLPALADGSHTFRVQVSDSAGKLSAYDWGANIVQPPTPSWLSPASGSIVYNGRPQITLSLADNTPGTTFSVSGQVRSLSALGPVVATFEGSGLAEGPNSFVLPGELEPGSYFLTATVTDAAGNSMTLGGSAARAFLALPAPAMGQLEECDGCHATLRDAHPTPAWLDCVTCHEGYDGDHMQGTEYCADCHYEGWHTDGLGQTVQVTSSCISCHTTGRPTVPTHTAENTAPAHQSSCDGCHVTTLTDAHSRTPEGSSYAYQCDLCHGSGADASVKAAVTAGDTTCSACHTDANHADVAGTHIATSEASLACGAAGCHYSTETVAIHSGRAEGGCAVCHNNPTSGNLTTGKTSKDCEGCHTTSGVDYHLNMAVHTTPPADYETCGHCHHAWGSNPTKGPDVTRHEAGCGTCHNETLDLTGLTTSCASCHNEEGVDYHYETAVRHTPVDPVSLDCAKCHETTDVRVLHATPGCETCHATKTCTECHNLHNGSPGTPLLSGLTCTTNCHTTEGTDYHAGFATAHTNSAMGANCQAAGCHSNSLTDAHAAFVGEGNRYPEYADTCELCHTNADPERIPADATADCATCHGTADHEALHAVERTDQCAECHAGTTLTALHAAGGTTCAGCHQSTDQGVIDAIAGHQRECAACHDVVQPHGDDTLTHTATLGSGSIRVFDEHEGWTQAVYYLECSMCHTTDLAEVHADQCSTCHPTPRNTFTTWNKSCQQGGCHVQFHEGADAAHQNAYNSEDCETYCHNSDWSVPAENCLLCHTPNDTIAPTSGSNVKASYVGPATISFWAGDPYPTSGLRATYYRVDGGPATAGSSVYVGAPAAGSAVHTLEYWALDNGGNVEVHKNAVFTITADVTPPTTNSNAASSYIGPAAITLSPTDNATGGWGVKATYYKIDGGPQTTGTSISVPQPASGSEAHTLEFWSEDWSGNVEAVQTRNFTITADTTAPSTTSNAVPYYNTSSSIRITFTASDPGGSGVQTTYYKLNNGPTYSGSTTYWFYQQGSYTLEFWSVDKAGNAESPHNFVTFVKDWTRPVTTSNAQPSYTGTANITLSPTDTGGSGLAATYYRIDSGVQTAGTSFSVSGTGTHTIYFWSVDKAGNTETQKSATFNIIGTDTTAPTTLSNFNPAAGATYTSNRPVTLSATDNTGGSGVKTTYYRIDSGAWLTGTAFTVTGDGLHTFSYYSTDYANNAEPTKTSNQFRIDSTPPVTASSAVNGESYTGGKTFTFSATDAGSGVASTWYRLDAGAWVQGTSVLVPAPSEGTASHTLEWYSIDNATNQETVKSATFMMLPTGGSGSGAQSFAFTGANQSFTVPSGVTALTVDLYGAQGGDIESWSGGLGGYVEAVIPVTPGQVLTIRVGGTPNPLEVGGWPNGGSCDGYCGSAGGGSSSILAGSTVLAEAGAGGGADHEGFDGGAGGLNPATLPGGNEPGGYGYGAGGGGGWNGGAGYDEHSGGGDGGTSYIAVGTGTMTPGVRPGNGQVVVSWTGGSPDSTPPTTTSSFNPAAGANYNSNRVVTLSATDNTDGSGVLATYYRVDGGTWRAGTSFTVSGDGLHTFSYYSVDNSNNTEDAITSNQFRIDTVAPSTASSAANGQSYTGDQTFALTPSDAGSGVASTWYRIDGGAWTQGTSISVAAPSSGSVSHTIQWYSIDNATNQESTKSATVTLSAPGTQTADLIFRWHPSGWGEANVHVENAQGVVIAQTSLSGTGTDLDWTVTVPVGQSYYMVCDWYWDEDWADEGGGYGVWKDVSAPGIYEWWY